MASGEYRHLRAICFPGEGRTSRKGACMEQDGRQGGCIKQAKGKQPEAEGQRGWRAARRVWGALCCKETSGKADGTVHSSPLGTTHIHWTSLVLPHVPGLLHVMCPQSHSPEQSESHCGATCLYPPRTCWNRNPCHSR